MKTMTAFLKKEWMEWIRSGKLVIMLIIFVILGIMNPAFAKITPWLMETMSDSLEGAGLMVGDVKVDAMTSWTQYYKNMPIALIVFVLMISTTFTYEYQKGSLVLVVTKGLARWKIYTAKAIMLVLLWTGCYWMQYGITYFYNDFYWDNKIAENPLIAAGLVWLFGIMMIALVLMFSAVVSNNTMVLVGTGAIAVVSYIAEMFPKVDEYAPTRLLGTYGILCKENQVSDYYAAVIVVLVVSVVAVGVGNVAFQRKRL